MASFHLRIPEDLHEQLTLAAEREERSLQREIVFRLRRSFVGEVASAETRARAAAVPEPDTPETVAAKAKGARAAIDLARTRLGGEEADAALSAGAVESPAPAVTKPTAVPSLPDTERRERHEACRKRPFHHIYHGSKPCPECGYPA